MVWMYRYLVLLHHLPLNDSNVNANGASHFLCLTNRVEGEVRCKNKEK